METSNGKRKIEAQAIFLKPFTVCSSCNRKFVVCPFANKETNRSYPFTNGQNGRNGLAVPIVRAVKKILHQFNRYQVSQSRIS
jgi:hypothetical protein